MSNVMCFLASGINVTIQRRRNAYMFELLVPRSEGRGKPRRIRGLSGFVSIDAAAAAAQIRAREVAAELGLNQSRGA